MVSHSPPSPIMAFSSISHLQPRNHISMKSKPEDSLTNALRFTGDRDMIIERELSQFSFLDPRTEECECFNLRCGLVMQVYECDNKFKDVVDSTFDAPLCDWLRYCIFLVVVRQSR
jgi:hypothetical protein